MRYRRAAVPGGTFFFTVNLADRDRRLLVDHIDHLRTAFRHVQARQPFCIDAIVILPEHLHTIWTLPEGDKDFATRWMLIKMGFSRAIPFGERRNPSRASKFEFPSVCCGGKGGAGVGCGRNGSRKGFW